MHPRLYEIHTYPWLVGLSAREGRAVTLATVPDADLDSIAELGADSVWLMGVWERSPAARVIGLEMPALQEAYSRALPGWQSIDVPGSPYAIRRYEVEPRLGSRQELAALRERLASRGLKLILDFVPNHVALDHPWLSEAPECLLQGTEELLRDRRDTFFVGPGGGVFAHGKDPYFPPWTDTVQVDAFSPALREMAARTLLDIASQCDGARCDMAMLMANAVFSRTWDGVCGETPASEYWSELTARVKVSHPNFLFLAEVYWDMEWEMMQQGFDLAYDKRLYDRMREGPAAGISGHLRAEMAYQRRLVRFIENHDEPRAMTELGWERARGAAALMMTLPGGGLIHEGQEWGHRVKLPVQLGRRPLEEGDPALRALYRRLLHEVSHRVYREGVFQVRTAGPAWPGSVEHRGLVAYTHRLEAERRLVVVNWSGERAQGRIHLADMELRGRGWRLSDRMDGAVYERSGDEMAGQGLYVALGPWGAHVLTIE